MTTLRALFILINDEIILSKRYPTVEKKFEMILQQQYQKLPQDYKLSQIFKKEVQNLERKNLLEFNSNLEVPILENQEQNFFKHKMFSTQKANWFHFILDIEEITYPTLFFRNKKYIVILLPFLEEVFNADFSNKSQEEKNLILSKSFCFSGCITYAKTLLQYLTQENIQKGEFSKMQEFHLILSNSIPFGTIIDHDLYTYKELISRNKNLQNESSYQQYLKNIETVKLPQFKQFFQEQSKKHEMEIIIREEIINYQFGNSQMKDFKEVIGKIQMNTQVVANPEITIAFSGINQEIYQNLQMSVQGRIYKTENIKQDGVKLLFYPHNKPFQLCKYHINSGFELPIVGLYQLKSISPGEFIVLINLKFNKIYCRKFEKVEVQIPFKKYHKIIKVDIQTQKGYLQYHQSQEGFDWIIKGSDINQSNLDISLTGTVFLQEELQKNSNEFYNMDQKKSEFEKPLQAFDQKSNFQSSNQDQQLIELNQWKIQEQLSKIVENYTLPEYFIDIRFSIKDLLLSQVSVNPSTINVYPYKGCKIKIKKKISTYSYFVYSCPNHNLVQFILPSYDNNLFQKNFKEENEILQQVQGEKVTQQQSQSNGNQDKQMNQANKDQKNQISNLDKGEDSAQSKVLACIDIQNMESNKKNQQEESPNSKITVNQKQKDTQADENLYQEAQLIES